MQILGTGLTGLVGLRLIEVLPQVEFTSISRKNGADILSPETIEPYIKKFSGEHVLHMAAYADVDGSEKDKELGEEGIAWKTNVLATKNIAELCKKYDKTLIYISTDFVFGGQKKEHEGYTEDDTPNPINWYGQTKFEGEKAVQTTGGKNLIVRIAYPYGKSNSPKKDFVRQISERLINNREIKAVVDHRFVPTYIDDVASGIVSLCEKKMTGIYHLTGKTELSPFDAAVLIAKAIGVDSDVIKKTTREEFFDGRANRPYNLYLKNDKINNLGIHTRSFEEGLNEMRSIL